MSLDSLLLTALGSFSPSTIVASGVAIFLWRELTKEREARIAALQMGMDLGHLVKTTLDRQGELIQRLLEASAKREREREPAGMV